MKKIWQKWGEQEISPIIEKYTVGNDYLLDMQLIPYDIQASKAHASMLENIGIISKDELQKLQIWLEEILNKYQLWEFSIDISQEDCHTAIETYLTEHYWDVGKKVHTWRSRNDQILVTLRLFSLDMLGKISKQIEVLMDIFDTKIKEIGETPMPGYTHTQRAMPTTVGLWLWSYKDALRDTLILIEATKKINNQNPLGSAAWYGDAWLWLKREITTEILGFEKTQENPIYCASSRGKFEYIVLQALSHIMMDLGKLANELVYFSSSEFDFFILPDSFKTGSSIMPQKKNWDIMELVRGNTNLYLGYEFQIREIYKMLFMWYNRDLQLTKEPYLKWIQLVQDTLDVMMLTVSHLWVNNKKLQKAMADELYATEEAYKLVKEGMSFRDAYKKVGKKYSL